MSIYTPTNAEQETYTAPVDDDAKDVASVLAFLQGLADGADAGVRIAFNWATVLSTSFAFTEACFDAVDQAWWAVGNDSADQLVASWDRGYNWNAASISTGVNLLAVATDASGNGLAIDASAGAYFGARSAFATVAWTHHTSVLSIAPTAEGIGLCRDVVHSNWICVYVDIAINHLHAEYLHTGTAFTVGTVPSSWTTTTYAFAYVNCDHGTAVAAMLSTGGALLLSRSLDGGVTWIDPTSFPPAAAITLISRPTYDPVYETWYVTASDGTTSSLYRSVDDGDTWSRAPITFAVADLVAINGILVALDFTGRILRSFDGVAWKHTTANSMGNAPSAGNTKLRDGDGQLLEISRDDSHVCASLVVGAKGGAA